PYAPSARGTNDTGKSAANGTWGVNSSWTDNSVPGNGDTASFQLAGTYAANFNFPPAAIQGVSVINGANVHFQTELFSGGPFTLNATFGGMGANVLGGATLTLGGSVNLSALN